MSREELIVRLELIAKRRETRRDPEMDHAEADELLLAYINDAGVSMAFESIEKWYA